MGKKLIVTALAVLCLVFFTACSGSSPDTSGADKISYYGGSIPVGDYIEIQLDRVNKLVRHINFTQGNDSGWLSYSTLANSDANASGFTIINKVQLPNDDYVLFAEFPNTALVYQLFNGSTNEPLDDQWPVYVICREAVAKENYYGKAYNWMNFKIDPAAKSSMECGFAAFDNVNGGLMYGAGYNSENDAINNINNGGVKVADFTPDSNTSANIMWTDSNFIGNMAYAITLTGTQSGACILDFGPQAGGGMGIAIPQADIELTQVSGTYFALVYEETNSTTGFTKSVQRMKMVITSEKVKVYNFNGPTTAENLGDNLYFDSNLTKVADLSADASPRKPDDSKEKIITQFATISGNSSANSAIVKAAQNCKGTFVAKGTNQVVAAMFDPSGKFFTFTMSDKSQDSPINSIVRFGFAIKDSAYQDPID